jgi:hypothetical protein
VNEIYNIFAKELATAHDCRWIISKSGNFLVLVDSLHLCECETSNKQQQQRLMWGKESFNFNRAQFLFFILSHNSLHTRTHKSCEFLRNGRKNAFLSRAKWRKLKMKQMIHTKSSSPRIWEESVFFSLQFFSSLPLSLAFALWASSSFWYHHHSIACYACFSVYIHIITLYMFYITYNFFHFIVITSRRRNGKK